MPPRSQPSSHARVLAPAALVVCAFAVLVVVAASLGGGDSGGGSASPTASESEATGERTAPRPRQPATYTIESGDTLGGIAEQTGIPVETLQELNPELDPQALIAGQKIKLRE